ncbi:MAG: ATP-binding protein [Bacteroidia bacterium]
MEKEFINGKIGKVIEVNSERVIIEVSNELNNYNIIHKGNLFRIGQVGSFVKITNGLSCLYCVVESFSTFMQSGEAILNKKVINVALLGFKSVTGEFESGAKITPSIDDSAYIIDEEDVNIIFKSDVNFPVKVGDNYFSNSLPVYVNLNDFVLKHSLVVGSTGSGKSNTVAYLLNNIVSEYHSARSVIIDIHGEYMNYLNKDAVEFTVYDKASKLIIPYWMLDFDTLCKLFGLSTNGISTAVDIFRDRILQMKREYIKSGPLKGKIHINNININSPIPFDIKEIWFEFHCRGYGTFKTQDKKPINYDYQIDDDGSVMKGNASTLEKPLFKIHTVTNTAPYKSDETYFRSLSDNMLNIMTNTDFEFMFGGDDFILGKKNIEDLISSWVENDKQITVLNLSGIPYNIIDVVIGIISNLLFDIIYYSLKCKKTFEGRPLLICFEEAHKYLNSGTQNSFSQKAVEKIMKEGRKFGIGAMIISQRPVEIPSTVISQVSTFIALRLTNSEDQSQIIKFSPNNFSTFLKSLPSLGNGDAFVIGESMKIPMKVKIPLLDSVKNIAFDTKISSWKDERLKKYSYTETIERWMQK